MRYYLLFSFADLPNTARTMSHRYYFYERKVTQARNEEGDQLSGVIFFRVYDDYLLSYGWMALAEVTKEAFELQQPGKEQFAYGTYVMVVYKFEDAANAVQNELIPRLQGSYTEFLWALSKVFCPSFLRTHCTFAIIADTAPKVTRAQTQAEIDFCLQLQEYCHYSIGEKSVKTKLERGVWQCYYSVFPPSLDFSNHLKPAISYVMLDRDTQPTKQRTIHSFGTVAEYRGRGYCRDIFLSLFESSSCKNFKVYVNVRDSKIIKFVQRVGFVTRSEIKYMAEGSVWWYKRQKT